MRKSKQFQGMNVVSLEEGQQIGAIRGLVINPAQKNVAALIIEQKGWFREQKFIPFTKVHSIGEDIITIDRINRAEKGSSLPEILTLFKDRVNVIGSRLVAENGTALGMVDEYYIDLQTGDIVGLEFSGGTVNNLFRGSAFLDINHVRTLGTRIVICNNSCLDSIVKMDGGLQEALKSFRKNTGQLLETTFQKTRGLSRSLNQSLEKIRKDRKKDGEDDGEDIKTGEDSSGSGEYAGSQPEETAETGENILTADPALLQPPGNGDQADAPRKEN
ncbi:MAG: hypothetical protein VR68_07300 [Peptococcaceae bacterium BRH_c4a]|nr:MAG: hypothetical protein VR68_07300 [Peptococcaceae bacterium BRH_c4a]